MDFPLHREPEDKAVAWNYIACAPGKLRTLPTTIQRPFHIPPNVTKIVK